mgnify:FL=1
MSELNQDDILDNLRDVNKNNSLLDILLEFEKVLEDTGVYAYKNWDLGEIVEGPNLSRYWLHVKLMYPYMGMPDPKAGIRLEKIGCEIKFNKGILKTPIIPQSPDDLDNEGMPKLKSDAIWMIDVWMPRKFIDNFTDEKIKIGSEEVDVTDLNDAYTSGLDDNTNINSQEI